MTAHAPHVDPDQARSELRDLTPEQRRLDALCREVYGTPLNLNPRPSRVKPKRPCDRCGILTRRPDLCLDCLAVAR